MKEKYIEAEGYIISLDSINGIMRNKYSKVYMINIELKTKLKYVGVTNTLSDAVKLYLKAIKKYKGAKVLKTKFKQLELF